jgi:hypothetical protein
MMAESHCSFFELKWDQGGIVTNLSRDGPSRIDPNAARKLMNDIIKIVTGSLGRNLHSLSQVCHENYLGELAWELE